MTERQGKPRAKLIRELAVVLLCKLLVIFALWYCFFGPDKRIEQTPENVAVGILGTPGEKQDSFH